MMSPEPGPLKKFYVLFSLVHWSTPVPYHNAVRTDFDPMKKVNKNKNKNHVVNIILPQKQGIVLSMLFYSKNKESCYQCYFIQNDFMKISNAMQCKSRKKVSGC